MAWEWVSPAASAFVGTVVGVTGVITTYKSGKQGRAHAEQVARSAADNSTRLAREARRQDRLAQAYLALLGLTADWLLWSIDVRPLFVADDTRPAGPPTGSEQKRVMALLVAFGSAPVHAKYEELLDCVRNIDSANGDLAIADETIRSGQETDIPRAEILKRLHHELKPALRRAHEELEELVAAELAQVGDSERAGATQDVQQ